MRLASAPTDARRHGLFIDGRWRDTGTTFTSLNPATEEPVAGFAAANECDVGDAVASARAAFGCGAWPRMRAAERGPRIDKLSFTCSTAVGRDVLAASAAQRVSTPTPRSRPS